MSNQLGNEQANFWGSGACMPLTLHELKQVNATVWTYLALLLTFALWRWGVHVFDLCRTEAEGGEYWLDLAGHVGVFAVAIVIYVGVVALIWVAMGVRSLTVDLIVFFPSALLSVAFGRGYLFLTTSSFEKDVTPILAEVAILTICVMMCAGMLLFLVHYKRCPEKMDSNGNTPSFANEDKVDDLVSIGSLSVPPYTLISMTSSGHYLTVETTLFSREIRLSMNKALSGLPSDAGKLVYRSIWVSRYAVVGLKRQGGRVFVNLNNGEAVRVARPRQSEITTWLRDLGFN